jgi:phage tail sheath gpL-like
MATSNLNPSSLAAAVSVGTENVRSIDAVSVLPRKILLYGQADPSFEGDKYEIGKLYNVISADDVGNRFGFGYEIHRLAKWSFKRSQNVETWVVIDEPGGTPVSAEGLIQVTANGVLAGTLHMYVSGEYVPVKVNDDDDATTIEAAIVATINEDKTLFLTASSSSPVADAANLISKNEGVYGNFVKVTFNEGFGQEFPIGLSVVVTQPTGGTGGLIVSDSGLFDLLGLNDEQNLNYFTELVLSTPLSTTNLDRVSVWNGEGNDRVGNYSEVVQRPLTCLFGDVEAGSVGLENLISFGNLRKQDRTNGVVAVPGSPNHPQEIAALATGIAARISNFNPAQTFIGEILTEVWPGAPEDRWVSSYSSRDRAVKAGISPTLFEDGFVKLQNLMTFYHPDSVKPESNGYRSKRSIAVMQNISNSVRQTFKQEKWQGISIVADTSRVTNLIARQKVRDVRAVEDQIVALAFAWAGESWIADASFTLDRVRSEKLVQVRPGGTGFDLLIPVVLSGETWIINSLIQFDTALTVFVA